MSDVGQLIGQVIQGQSEDQQSRGDPSKINTWFILNYYRVKVQITEVLIEKRDVAGNAFIVGDATLSQLPVVVGTGTAAWATHALDTTPSTIITDVGRRQFAKWLAGETPNQPNYIAWGTSDTDYAVTQTTLVNEIRREGTTTNGRSNYGIGTIQMDITANASYTGALHEVGLFDASSVGNMWFRAVISPFLQISTTLSTRVTFTYAVEDETTTPHSILTNYGLNHLGDCLYNGASVFDYTGISDGIAEPAVTDITLDGANIDKNQIDAKKRKNFTVDVSTPWDTTEFNSNDMGKLGNFVTGAASDLVTETLLTQQTKESTFKIINKDVFDVV